MAGLGTMQYGTTQYAHPGGRIFNGIKLFVETVVLSESGELRTIFEWAETILIEVFSFRSFLAKIFTETILLTDTWYRNVEKTLIETIHLIDIGLKSLWKKFLENIVLDDVFSKAYVAVKLFIESLRLIDVTPGAISKKLFQEIANLSDELSSSVVGMFFLEVANLSDSINKTINKTFAEIITFIDHLRRKLNGFFMRWTKRDNSSATYLKRKIPEATYTKKNFATATYTKRDRPTVPTYTKRNFATNTWVKKNRPDDLE